jgi:hypothetical protein
MGDDDFLVDWEVGDAALEIAGAAADVAETSAQLVIAACKESRHEYAMSVAEITIIALDIAKIASQLAALKYGN